MAKKKVEEEVEFKEYSNENIIKEICNKVDDVELIDTQDEEFISTGNFALDYIISGKFWKGGIPLGRISEIYGNSSSGKTVVATHVLQNVQKEGGIAILIDSENAYNAQFAQVLGIDVKSLVYSNSETLEGCYTSIVKMVNLIRNKTNRPVMIVYDSIAASPSKDEREKITTGEDLKSEMGKRAQISSAYLRTLAGLLKKQRIGLVVINQLRSKVGVLYGDPNTTAGGGRSLEYYCSVRLECKKRKSIVDEKERAMGIFLDVNNTKNKLASPFRKVQELELFFNKGICPISGLLDILIQEDRVTKSGAWCTIVGTEYKFQAKNLLKALLDNPSLIDCPSKEDLEEFISRNKHSLSESISNEDAIEKSRELETEEVE